jgi:hypothetical protein
MSRLRPYIMGPSQVSGFFRKIAIDFILFQIYLSWKFIYIIENVLETQKYIFTWNVVVTLKVTCCTKMMWNNQKTTLVQLKLASPSSKV